MEEVDFVVMARPGWDFDWDSTPGPFRHLGRRVVPAPLIEISASEIRRRVAVGQSIEFLTPPAVVSYIRDNQLYAPRAVPRGRIGGPPG